jgi:predicted amidophosphoribosyltransferase
MESGNNPILLTAAAQDCVCLFPLTTLTRSLVHALKYKGAQDIAPYLARHASEATQGLLRAWGRSLFVPIPVHSARRRERGYNQCEGAAGALAELCGGALATRILRRKVYQQSQTTLGKDARGLNVAGAFEAERAPENPPGIVVVDDVYTTGATTSAAVRALQVSGWPTVRVCALLCEIPASHKADWDADQGLD